MTTAWPEVALGELVAQKIQKMAKPEGLVVASITRGKGLIPQDQVFKKQIASRDLSKYKVVSYGDVVVGIHIDEGAIGTSLLHDDHLVSPAYSVWSVRDQEKVDSNYLGRFLRSPLAIRYFIANYRKTAERRGKLTQESLLALKIPLPPLNEQRRIAAILDKADELRSKQKAALETLEALSQAIFIEMFASKVVYPQVALGDVARFVNGAAFKPDDWIDDESGLRIIRIQNLKDPRKPYNRTHRKVAKDLYVSPGDLLVSWSASLGVFVWNEPDIALLNQHIFKVFPDDSLIEKDYLRHSLVKAVERMKLQVHGATMQHINRGEFLAVKIPLPSLNEQRNFCVLIAIFEQCISAFKESIGKVDDLFASLQEKAFKGAL